MDSFHEFMENNQYLDGGASTTAGASGSAKSGTPSTSTSGIPQSMGDNLKNDGKVLADSILENTTNDRTFRTDAAQPFKKLEVSHNVLQRQVNELTAKVAGLEKTVTEQTQAMGKIITLIKELRG